MTGDDDATRLRELLVAASALAPAGDAASAVGAVRRRVRRRRILQASLSGVTAAAVAASVAAVTSAAPPPGGPVPMPAYRLTGALRSFTGCGGYLHYVRKRAGQLVGPYGLSGPPVSMLYGKHMPVNTSAAGGPGAPMPLSGDELALHDAATPAHSQTTDQVPGVDEPDTVKTDGHVVVTLTGSTLRVLDTAAHVLGSLQLPGDAGGGLLLDGDRVVVLSSTDQSQISGTANPFGFMGPGIISPVPTTTAHPARAAVVDISDPSHPTLLRTFAFGGSLVGARLVSGQLHLALGTTAPRIDFQTPNTAGGAHAATVENRRLVAHSSLADWLPWWQAVSPNGSSTGRQPLAACDAVARPHHPTGIATVSVFSLDPAATAPEPATSVVAAGTDVYATADHLYLAGTQVRPLELYRHSPAPDPAGSRPTWSVGPRTHIYAFDTSGTRAVFLAAGGVRGTVPSSYAMDENAGYLRVASTVQNRRGRPHSRIAVLQVSGQALAHVGVVGRLGRDELAKAVRFIGDLAFVVTYRSYDPMYVVDLRDPRAPRVVGRLTQPGFSEFLYPLTPGRLVGVGLQLARNEPAQLLVSTYDITDPRHPRRLAASSLTHGFAASSAPYDPHAFLSWPPDHLVVVALPGDRGSRRGGGAVAYRVGDDGSLTRLAALRHGAVATTRTAVIGNELWGFTSTGVIVADLPDLSSPPAWHPYQP